MGAVVELTDEEWNLVKHLFDPPVHRGIKGTIPGRDIVDANPVARADRVPVAVPPGPVPRLAGAWSQWRRWRDSGTWAAAMRVLAREVRLRHKRTADPTMVMIDAQTVKSGRAGPTFHEAGGRGGYTRGAKRTRPTILIEILGLPLAVSVESAKPHDVRSARKFLKQQLDPRHRAARRKAEEGQARLHVAAPALQGRERFARLGTWWRLSRCYEQTPLGRRLGSRSPASPTSAAGSASSRRSGLPSRHRCGEIGKRHAGIRGAAAALHDRAF